MNVLFKSINSTKGSFLTHPSKMEGSITYLVCILFLDIHIQYIHNSLINKNEKELFLIINLNLPPANEHCSYGTTISV